MNSYGGMCGGFRRRRRARRRGDQAILVLPGARPTVARNLREFSNHVSVMGLIGTCAHAGQLRKLSPITTSNLDCLQEDPDYQTIVKTRVIAGHQQVVRVDRERKVGLTALQTERVGPADRETFARAGRDHFRGLWKGIVAAGSRGQDHLPCRKNEIVITVDPNPTTASGGIP